jgi:flagellar biosynthesis protein FlhG
MNDQAERLRNKLKLQNSTVQPRTLAVVSGKGGVGKSNFSLNFAISIAEKGHSVLLIDMDIGMGNIDILMGLSSTYSIADFFTNSVPLNEIITEISGGIHYISGGSGLSQLIKIESDSFTYFTEQFTEILNRYEYVILDMGAGISEDSLRFILSVDDVLIMTTPEPTSITDAYAAMKYITLKSEDTPFYVIVNRVHSEGEGKTTFNRLSKVMKQFLKKDIVLLGMIPDDKTIPQAVRKQIPFTQLNGKAPASKALNVLTDKYCQRELEKEHHNSKQHFVTKLKRLLFER